MAEARRSPPRKPGPTGRLLALAAGFGFWLVFGALGNILVEWAGMMYLWPGEGVAHSLATLKSELGTLDRDFPEGVFIARPARLAGQLSTLVYDQVYREWQLGRWFQGAQARSAQEPPSLGGVARKFLGNGRDYLLAAVIATQVYAIRLAVMVAASPVFLLATLVTIPDGFGQRDVRKFSGGRERGQVYHLARHFVVPMFTASWLLYLAWPTPAHPNLFILPFAALFGFALWVMTGSFKKYL
jgi:integrating conjugative element membrane protein (TIGR03747 family)